MNAEWDADEAPTSRTRHHRRVSHLSRHAHLERERRFLVPAAPAVAVTGLRVLQIEDRYLRGTRLRLRTVHEADLAPVRKLGQKVRPNQDHPSTVEHTTMYLDDAEAAALLALAADALAKTRTLHPWHGLAVAVDVFAGQLTGLVLAEVDLGAAGVLPTSRPPVAWIAEVTNDERLTGGHLARTSATQLTAGSSVSKRQAVEDAVPSTMLGLDAVPETAGSATSVLSVGRDHLSVQRHGQWLVLPPLLLGDLVPHAPVLSPRSSACQGECRECPSPSSRPSPSPLGSPRSRTSSRPRPGAHQVL